MEIQVDIEAKPSHYQLVSGSSTEDSLHVHAQMVENEEEGGSSGGNNEEDPPCKHQSCEQKDCLANKAWDISLAQPESIRSDLESSDTQSDDVPDITSDECGSPHPQAAACPSTPRAPGAPSPSAHRNLSAPAEGKTVLKLEDAEARVWSGMNAPVLRSTLMHLLFVFLACVLLPWGWCIWTTANLENSYLLGTAARLSTLPCTWDRKCC